MTDGGEKRKRQLAFFCHRKSHDQLQQDFFLEAREGTVGARL